MPAAAAVNALGRVDHGLGERQQLHALGRYADAAGGSFDQVAAEAGFQGGQRLRQRRLAYAESCCCTAEMPFLRHRDERAQPGQRRLETLIGHTY